MYVGETLKVQSLWNAFNMKSVLQAHISKRHFLISLLRLCVKEWMQMKEYECSISEMAFKLNANTHCKHNKGAFPDILSLQVKPLKCRLCVMTFKMKSVLLSHLAHITKRHFLISLLWLWVKKSLQMKPYNCSLCEMTFKMKSVLQSHLPFPQIIYLQLKYSSCKWTKNLTSVPPL